MISIIYESKELDPENGEWNQLTRKFTTAQEDVNNIVPEGDKVGIHLSGNTILVPFNRVYELSIDLDEETVEQVAGGQEE